MKGLLKKAIELRGKIEPTPPEEDGIGYAEREEILEEINKIVSQHRIDIETSKTKPKPIKRDIIIPLLINIFAVILLASGIYLLSYVFDKREESYVTKNKEIMSAESKVISTLKEESEKQLNQKNKEIKKIQERLQEIARQKQNLELTMQQKIKEREAKLKAQLQEALKREREKLSGKGYSEAEINKRLKYLSAKIKKSNQQELEKYKQETQAELKKKQEEIERLMKTYQSELTKAREEQKRLESFYKQKEAELKEKYQSEKAALERKTESISAQLFKMKELRRKESLALDRIIGIYKKIQQAMETSDYETAKELLHEQEKLLSNRDMTALPAIKARIPVEKITIDSLKSLIAEKIENKRLREYEKLIKNIDKTIKTADYYYRKKQYGKAKYFYTKAMNQIASIKQGYSRLSTMQEQEYKKKLQKTVQEIETEANATITNLNSRILNLHSQLENVKKQLAKFKTEKDNRENKLKTFAERLNSLRAEYTRLLNTQRSTDNTQDQLLSVLETKVLVKQILTSDEIKKRYPTIYEEFEKSFTTYGNANRLAGEKESLSSVNKLLRYLNPSYPPTISSSRNQQNVTPKEIKENPETLHTLINLLKNLERLIKLK